MRAWLLASALSVAAGEPLAPLPGTPRPPEARVELGRRLFSDPRLSRTGTMSCATCHDPAKAFTDGFPRTRGPHGKELGRHAMTLLNAAGQSSFFWDGRAATLEEQALEPFLNPEEMALTVPELLARVAGDAAYARLHRRAFPGRAVSTATVAAAVADFERTLTTPGAPVDRFLSGERGALPPEALRGLALFTGKARCSVCHSGPLLTDGKFRNIGVAPAGPWKRDPGRQRVDLDERSRRAFKTPGLRNAALTAPYMHNGSLPTLRAVVRFYDRGGDVERGRDPDVLPLGLTEAEREALVAFLESLTGTLPAAAEGAGSSR